MTRMSSGYAALLALGLSIAAPCVPAAAATAAPAAAGEQAERKAIAEQVRQLVEADDHRGLEALARRYRSGRERTGSGTWKLVEYYEGITRAFPSRTKDPAVWDARQAWAERWVALHPDSPAAHLALVQVLLNRAWSYRGGGYAHTVPEQNWAPFRQYTGMAQAHLAANKKVAAKDPYWYYQSALVAQRQSWETQDFMALYEESAARYPDFFHVAFVGVNYFSPRWGGSDYAIESFARHALARAPARQRATLYARLYWSTLAGEHDRNPMEGRPVDWPLMRRGIDDLLARYPSDWNLQHLAYFACMAEDKPQTHRLMDRITQPPELSAWGSAPLYDHCHQWAEDA